MEKFRKVIKEQFLEGLKLDNGNREQSQIQRELGIVNAKKIGNALNDIIDMVSNEKFDDVKYSNLYQTINEISELIKNKNCISMIKSTMCDLKIAHIMGDSLNNETIKESIDTIIRQIVAISLFNDDYVLKSVNGKKKEKHNQEKNKDE